jgi:hypothetical protein
MKFVVLAGWKGKYRVFQKSLNGFAKLYLRNPWDYRNGIGAKRCVLSLSFE